MSRIKVNENTTIVKVTSSRNVVKVVDKNITHIVKMSGVISSVGPAGPRGLIGPTGPTGPAGETVLVGDYVVSFNGETGEVSSGFEYNYDVVGTVLNIPKLLAQSGGAGSFYYNSSTNKLALHRDDINGNSLRDIFAELEQSGFGTISIQVGTGTTRYFEIQNADYDGSVFVFSADVVRATDNITSGDGKVVNLNFHFEPNIASASEYFRFPDGTTATSIVTSFNGETGDVFGVSSVNGQTGNVNITGTEYYAGTGLTLSGFTFSEEGWLREDEAFPETVGGVEAGTTFANGTTAIQILESLLYPYQPVSFSAFSIGLTTTYFEVGQTGGNVTRNASWSTSGPVDNWVSGSLSIVANQGIGTLVSGLNYNDSPESITHGAYNFTTETTLTFTISGEQDQGGDPSRNSSVYWRYRYFSGRTGGGFDGTNLTSQGFDDTLTRTSPDGWTITFPAVFPGNKGYFIIPSNEYSGTPTFTDTSTNLTFPFNFTGTFTHTNAYGFDVDYDIYESQNAFAGQTTIRVNV